MLDGAVLALSDQGGPGQDHGERGDLVDEGHDGAEPGGLAVGVEGFADDDAKGKFQLRVRPVDEQVDAVDQHVLDVAGTDAGLLHGRGVHINLDLGGPATTKVELEPGRDGDDEHVLTAVHGGGGVSGRDDLGVLEAVGRTRRLAPWRAATGPRR